MAFIESPRFPDSIAFGAVGGPQFSTDIVTTFSGDEQRNRNWDRCLARYEVGLDNKEKAETDRLRSFFLATAVAKKNAFRFKDWVDYTAYDQELGTGDGIEDTYQLLKLYTSGAESYTRLLQKPVAGTVVAKLNGTPTTAFTVDTTTGLLTFSSPPGAGVVVTASCEFDVPVRFDADWLDLQRVEVDIYSWASVILLESREIA